MIHVKVGAVLLLRCLSFALAASISSPSPVIALDKPPRNAFADNISSNITAPIPRRGFRTKFVFDESKILRPFEIYENIIHLMKRLSTLGWHSMIHQPQVMSASVDPQAVYVCIYPLNQHPPDSLEMDIAVAGLYETGLAIAKRNAFYKLDVFLYVGKEIRGQIIVYPQSEYPDFPPLPPLTIDDFSTESVGVGANNTPLTVDRGRITDPKDKKFILTFHYDGVKIHSADVFTCFLNFFAIAAERADDSSNAYVPLAPSATGDVILSTWVEGEGEGKQKQLMTGARLKRAVLMVWARIVKENGGMGNKPRFEGWEIGFEYDGLKIGGGRMLKV